MIIKTLASGSDGNCHYISDGKTSLLLDAGIPFGEIQKGLDYKVNEVAGCLVTHSHQDHCRAVKDLVKRGIRCYGNSHTKEQTSPLMRALKPLFRQTIKTLDVLPFDVSHDVPCYGYIVSSLISDDKLLYITDLSDMVYGFMDVSHMICECNYSEKILERNVQLGIVSADLAERIRASHLSIERLAMWLGDKIKLDYMKKVQIVHLSNNNSDEEEFVKVLRAKVPGVEIISA